MVHAHQKIVDELEALYERKLLGHAYIFFGAPRIGKTAAARALARRIETGSWSPDSEKSDESVRPLTDAQVFSPDDKGVIGIDAARAVKLFLAERPFLSSRRVAIIETAQALTPEAQNALLKVAEEPPESALLILVMTDPEILWPTLQSRFQKIYFPPLPPKEMRQVLESSVDPFAARFLKVAPAGRKDFVKELTEPENFNFAGFLDALIAHLAVQSGGNPTLALRHGRLWHAVLELRRMQDATSLSPRIQLMNLWTFI